MADDSVTMPKMPVPVIDMSLPEEVAAQQLRQACIEVGFFFRKHHLARWHGMYANPSARLAGNEFGAGAGRPGPLRG